MEPIRDVARWKSYFSSRQGRSGALGHRYDDDDHDGEERQEKV